jgi:hypothetical protein
MSITDAPPSTRLSASSVPLAFVIASTTSADWKAIASTTARATGHAKTPRPNSARGSRRLHAGLRVVVTPLVYCGEQMFDTLAGNWPFIEENITDISGTPIWGAVKPFSDQVF